MTRRTYIAGPMSGLPDYNYPAFHAAEAALRDAGHTPVNPADPNLVGQPWQVCMRAAIALLITCDQVAMLPGWHTSRGARLERRIALDLGLHVAELATFTAVPR